jgi:hypothetical protein
MTEPTSLRFVRRFRNGTLCEMTVHLLANGTPCSRPHYVWKGPVPRLRGERLNWELSCFRTIADPIKRPNVLRSLPVQWRNQNLALRPRPETKTCPV